MKESTRNVLIGTGVFLLCPFVLMPAVILATGGYFTYKATKKVKKGYVKNVRENQAIHKSAIKAVIHGSLFNQDNPNMIYVGKNNKVGFIKAGFGDSSLQPLRMTKIIKNLNPITNRYTTKEVVLREYKYYNPKTACAEIPTKPFEQLVGTKKNPKVEFCDRVSVKINKEGKIDWSNKTNRTLFCNPKAVSEVLRRYPESFRTIPEDILHHKLEATNLQLGDYFQRTIKNEMIARLNGTSEYSTIIQRDINGRALTPDQYVQAVHKVVETKVNDYVSKYGTGARFASTAANWIASSRADEYFME